VPTDNLVEVVFPENETPSVQSNSSFVPSVTLDELLNNELPNPDDDLPISQLTIRDLVAILHKVPVSKKKWLNDIIKK